MTPEIKKLLSECEAFLLESVERPMLRVKRFNLQSEHEARVFEQARDLRDKINRAIGVQ